MNSSALDLAAQDVVAIDGPAGSGKSTVARHIAERFGFILLDTGAIYRALALRAWEVGVDFGDDAALVELAPSLGIRFVLDGEVNRVLLCEREVTDELRTPEISLGASRVSALPGVRAALLDLQRRVALEGTVVAEGRDVGTVVFPRARLKVFLDASAEERARRRHLELGARGCGASFEQVWREQEARDQADASRAVAPLRAADDAIRIDTTGLTLAQVEQRIADQVVTAGLGRGGG